MTILGLAEAAVYCDDLARAVAFYVDVLGLRLTAQFADAAFLQIGPDATLILFDREALPGRVSVIPRHGAVGATHVALAVPGTELARWRARLEAHGVAIEHEQRWSLGTNSLYFRDPDGNSIELIDSSHYPTVWKRTATRGENE